MKKINLLRIFVFCVSVYSLSVFFEAGRLIAYERTLNHLGMSIFSGLVFVLSLLLIGFWVYKEEKEKNNLKIKFGLYEWFYDLVIARRLKEPTKQSYKRANDHEIASPSARNDKERMQ